MRQLTKDQFAPRWVMLIYILTVVEAIGLSVYFETSLADPEMASMQSLSIDMEETPASMTAQTTCRQCLMVAATPQHAAVRHDGIDRDARGRMRERR